MRQQHRDRGADHGAAALAARSRAGAVGLDDPLLARASRSAAERGGSIASSALDDGLARKLAGLVPAHAVGDRPDAGVRACRDSGPRCAAARCRHASRRRYRTWLASICIGHRSSSHQSYSECKASGQHLGEQERGRACAAASARAAGSPRRRWSTRSSPPHRRWRNRRSARRRTRRAASCRCAWRDQCRPSSADHVTAPGDERDRRERTASCSRRASTVSNGRCLLERGEQKLLGRREPVVLRIEVGRRDRRALVGEGEQRQRKVAPDAVERGHERAEHGRAAEFRAEPEAPDRRGQECLLPAVAEPCRLAESPPCIHGSHTSRNARGASDGDEVALGGSFPNRPQRMASRFRSDSGTPAAPADVRGLRIEPPRTDSAARVRRR